MPFLALASPPHRARFTRNLARAALRALGVRLAVRGRFPNERALLVANHVSWLDIVAVLAHTPARLVAKQEVRRWPVIGALAAAAGTIFIDRSQPRALPRTVATAADVLRAGGVVAAFPEGTTWCGRAAGRFRPAMFQAALDGGSRRGAGHPAFPAGRRHGYDRRRVPRRRHTLRVVAPDRGGMRHDDRGDRIPGAASGSAGDPSGAG